MNSRINMESMETLRKEYEKFERNNKYTRVFCAVASILSLILLALICYMYRDYKNRDYTEQSPTILYGLYDVVRVVDGDTVVLDISGEEKTVRLIGVDAPESVHPDESRNSEDGKIASEWMSQYLSDKKVYIEYDKEMTDNYGRTLGYLYLDDGITMVQDELLKSGYATILTIAPNVKYAEKFAEIEQEAKDNKAGFWTE